jgi:hypothetical protein
VKVAEPTGALEEIANRSYQSDPLAFSDTGEKSGRKWRERTHRGDPGHSPRHEAENGTVRKCLALLGILREEGKDARRALASTTGGKGFGQK